MYNSIVDSPCKKYWINTIKHNNSVQLQIKSEIVNSIQSVKYKLKMRTTRNTYLLGFLLFI